MRRKDVLKNRQQIGDALNRNPAPTRVTALLDCRAGKRLQITGPNVERNVEALLVLPETEMQRNPVVGPENPLSAGRLNEAATRR
jgi:hypothetical protein